MKPYAILSVLLVGAALSTGCGKADGAGGGTTDPANPTAPGNTPAPGGREGGSTDPVSCEDVWIQYTKANPVGRKLKYETLSETTSGGSILDVRKSEREDVVTVSTNEVVTITTTHRALTPPSAPTTSSSSMERENVLAICKAGVGQMPETGMQFEVLAESRQTITVRAGKFDCAYKKIKITPTFPSVNLKSQIIERWTDDSNAGEVNVKSITVMESESGPTAIVTKVTDELVQRN